MFTITENAAEEYVELRLSGKLTKEAYDGFVPMLEEQFKEYGKLRILVEMKDFHGWDAAACWEDTKFGFRHFRDIERMAMVGENKWEHGMATFCRPFTMSKIKYFDSADIDKAREWLHKEHIPLHHYLLKNIGVLVLQPEDKLTKEDFLDVAAQVDPYIEGIGGLKGVMIDAPKFPGWDSMSDMMAHFKFVRDYHRDIKRVAIVSDDNVLAHLPGFAKHFVAADVKHFAHDDKLAAMDWLVGA